MIKKVSIFILCLFCLCFGIASAHGLEEKLQDFVYQVYEDYSAKHFSSVYDVMHPNVKEQITKEEYVVFQEHHFERLKLSISEIEVGEVKENPRIPSQLRPFLSADGEEVYGVELSYRARFVSGMRFNQRIAKTVYVAVEGLEGTERIFLLWDPTATQEEEQDNESN